MFSAAFWKTYVQLLSFDGYLLPEQLHFYLETPEQTKEG